MIYLIVILIMLVAFGVVYAFLYQSGLLEPPGRTEGGYGRSEPFRVPGFGELPQGCLMAIVVAAFVWFVTWGIVLILALRFLRSPLGD